MSGTATYQANIVAQDRLSEVLDRIGPHVDKLMQRLAKLPATTAPVVEQATRWQMLSQRINSVAAAAGGLQMRFASLHGTAASLLPPLAALSGLGALGGLFTLTNKVASGVDAGARTAEKLGLLPKQLGELGFVAKMTDTEMEPVIGAVSRLNIALGQIAAGKNKDAAEMFKALGISMRNARGEARSTYEIWQDVQKAFQVNTNPEARALIARTLFGRSGTELIYMLSRTSEELAKIREENERMKFSMSPAQRQALLDYDENWKKLTYAVGEYSKSLGAKLAPVLNDVLPKVERFLTANREAITGFASAKVEAVADALENADWERISQRMNTTATAAGKVVDALGGIQTVLLALAGLQAISWAGKIIAGLEAIGGAAAAAVAALTRLRGLVGFGAVAALSGDTPRNAPPAYGYQEGNWTGREAPVWNPGRELSGAARRTGDALARRLFGGNDSYDGPMLPVPRGPVDPVSGVPVPDRYNFGPRTLPSARPMELQLRILGLPLGLDMISETPGLTVVADPGAGSPGPSFPELRVRR